MLSKAKIKDIQSLQIKKVRDEAQLFIIDGEKMALEVISSKSIVIEAIYAIEMWLEQHKILLKHYNAVINAVSERELKQISNLSTPNKVVIVAHMPKPHYEPLVIENSLNLYLDGVQDPGNMGSILRIADWFSIPYIFCSSECVDIYNPKVIQASMGAFLRVKTCTTRFDDLKKRFPTLPTYAAVLNGDNIFNLKKQPSNGLIILGNEGAGVSQHIINQVDFKITIPGGGGAESLNVAVSTGIIVAAFKHSR